jgi:hypothetical protein
MKTRVIAHIMADISKGEGTADAKQFDTSLQV